MTKLLKTIQDKVVTSRGSRLVTLALSAALAFGLGLGVLPAQALDQRIFVDGSNSSKDHPYVLTEGKTYTAPELERVRTDRESDVGGAAVAVTNRMSGGVEYETAYLVGTNITFSGNRTKGKLSGGALYSKGWVSLSYSTFTNNYAERGRGGAFFAWRGSVTLDNGATFIGNTSDNGDCSGGAVCIWEAAVNMNGNILFKNNHAVGVGGALANQKGATLTINGDATFVNNTAVKKGGAIDNAGATLNFLGTIDLQTDTDTWINRVYSGVNAVVNWDLTQVTDPAQSKVCIKGFHKFGNYMQNGEVKSSQTLTVKADGAQPEGRYVIATGDFSRETMAATNVTEFIVTNGTAGVTIEPDGGVGVIGLQGYKLAVEESEAAGGDKLVLSVNNYTCTHTDVNEGELAELDEGKTYTAEPYEGYGGAFYVSGTIVGTNVTFKGNEVTHMSGQGGAIYIQGSHPVGIFEGATFDGNKATGELGSGGAICNDGGTLYVSHSCFTNNSTYGDGGALYNIIQGVATLDEVIFSGNSAKNGGAIYNSATLNFDGSVTLATDTDILYNIAGTLNWNLADGKQGLLNGYDKLKNYSNGKLQITIDDAIVAPTNIVIATGNFSKTWNKNVFTITNALGGAAMTATIDGGGVFSGGSIYELETVPDLGAESPTTNLVFTVIQPEMVKLTDVFLIDEEGKTNATAVVKFGDQTVEPNDDGSFEVPANYPLDVIYEAADDYMFGPGLKNKTVTLPNGVSGDGPMPAEYKELAEASCQARWVDEREIALDTRERIVVASPNEVLPIAYSTNAWGAYPEANWTRLYTNATTTAPFWLSKREDGYEEWMPQTGAYGKYDFSQKWAYQVGTLQDFVYGTTNATIYYSKRFPLTWEAKAGGTLTVTASNEQVAPGDGVLAFDYVHAIATAAEDYVLKRGWSVTTNKVAIACDGDLRDGTVFEMPATDTVINYEFVKLTGCCVNGEDIALGHGAGWVYSTNYQGMGLAVLAINDQSYGATNRVEITGCLPANFEFAYMASQGAIKVEEVVLENFTNNVAEFGKPAFRIGNSSNALKLTLKGNNQLVAGKGCPAISSFLNPKALTIGGDGFLDAIGGRDDQGALVPSIKSLTGSPIEIVSGTYTGTVDPKLVPWGDSTPHYAGFANNDLLGTWSVKPAGVVTYKLQKESAEAYLVVTNAQNETLTAPAVPSVQGYVFKGWTNDTLTAYWDFENDLLGGDELTLWAGLEAVTPTTPSSTVVPQGGGEPVVVDTFDKAEEMAPEGGTIVVSNETVVAEVDKPLIIEKGGSAADPTITPAEGSGLTVKQVGDTTYVGEETNGVLIVEQNAGVEPQEGTKPAAAPESAWQTLTNMANGVTASAVLSIIDDSVLDEMSKAPEAEDSDALRSELKIKVTPTGLETNGNGRLTKATFDVTPELTVYVIKSGVETPLANQPALVLSGDATYVKIPCGGIDPVALVHAHRGKSEVLRRTNDPQKLDDEGLFLYDAVNQTVTLAMSEFSDLTLFAIEDYKEISDTHPLTGEIAAGEILIKDDNTISNATIKVTKTITLDDSNVLTGPLTLYAPEGGVTNNGDLVWDLRGNNTNAWLNSFDAVTQTEAASLQILIDEQQFGENDFTNSYVLADIASTATGTAFKLDGDDPFVDTTIYVGAEALYAGAKSFSLKVNANSQLVFAIEMGTELVVSNLPAVANAEWKFYANGRPIAAVDGHYYAAPGSVLKAILEAKPGMAFTNGVDSAFALDYYCGIVASGQFYEVSVGSQPVPTGAVRFSGEFASKRPVRFDTRSHIVVTNVTEILPIWHGADATITVSNEEALVAVAAETLVRKTTCTNSLAWFPYEGGKYCFKYADGETNLTGYVYFYVPVEVTDGDQSPTNTQWSVKVDTEAGVFTNALGQLFVQTNSHVYALYYADRDADGNQLYFADGTTQWTALLPFVSSNQVNNLRIGPEYMPEAPDIPHVKLGIVAQRYPWDGKVDVEYMTCNIPDQPLATVFIVKIGDQVVTNDLGTAVQGTQGHKWVWDAAKDFPERKTDDAEVSAEVINQ